MPDIADMVARLRADDTPLQQALSKAQAELEKTAASSDSLANRLGGAFGNIGQKARQLNKDLGGIVPDKALAFLTSPGGLVAGGVVAALTTIGAAAVGVAKEWGAAKRALGEEGWKPADIEAAQGAITRLRGSTAGLNADMPTIARALDDVGDRLGLSGDKAEKVTGSFLKFGRVAGGDVTSNIAGVSKVLQSWHVDASKAGDVMDKLVVAQQNWGVSADKTEAALTKYGPILRNMGFDMDHSIALFSQFEKSGMNQQAMMAGLQKATALFAKEHIDAGKGLSQTFNAIKNARTEVDAAAIAFKTFGPKAGQAFVEAIRSGKFNLDEMTQALKNAHGATDSAVNASLTGSEKWGMAMERLKLRLLPVGEVLLNIGSKITNIAIAGLDAVGGAMDAVGGVISRFRATFANEGLGMAVNEALGFFGLPQLDIVERGFNLLQTAVGDGIQRVKDAFNIAVTGGKTTGIGGRVGGILRALGLSEDAGELVAGAIGNVEDAVRTGLVKLNTAFTMGMGAWKAGNFGAGAATFLDFLGFPSDVGTAVQAWVTKAETAIGGAKTRLGEVIAAFQKGGVVAGAESILSMLGMDAASIKKIEDWGAGIETAVSTAVGKIKSAISIAMGGGEDERGRATDKGAAVLNTLGLSMADAKIVEQWGQNIKTAIDGALGQISDVINRLRDDWKKDPLINYIFQNWGGSEAQKGVADAELGLQGLGTTAGTTKTPIQELDAVFKAAGETAGRIKTNWDANAASLNELATTIHGTAVGAVNALSKALDDQIATARNINKSISDLVTSIGGIASTIRGGVTKSLEELGTALGNVKIPNPFKRESPSPIEQVFMNLNALVPQTVRHMSTLQGAMGGLGGGAGIKSVADLARFAQANGMRISSDTSDRDTPAVSQSYINRGMLTAAAEGMGFDGKVFTETLNRLSGTLDKMGTPNIAGLGGIKSALGDIFSNTGGEEVTIPAFDRLNTILNKLFDTAQAKQLSEMAGMTSQSYYRVGQMGDVTGSEGKFIAQRVFENIQQALGAKGSAPAMPGAVGASNLPQQPIPVTIAPTANTSKGGNAAGTIIENLTITVTATYDARDMAQRIIAELGLMGIKINA